MQQTFGEIVMRINHLQWPKQPQDQVQMQKQLQGGELANHRWRRTASTLQCTKPAAVSQISACLPVQLAREETGQ